VLLTERLLAFGSLAFSLKVLFFSMLLFLSERVVSVVLLFSLTSVERRWAFAGVVVAVITAARVIIVASSLNFIVFMTSFFKIYKIFLLLSFGALKNDI
jgi:hypothetical protein